MHDRKEFTGVSLSTENPSPPGSGSLPSDSELVVLARSGDQGAFEQIFERYNDRICLYLVRMVGNDGVGSELTQETFLKVWQALPSLRDEARFVGWLYRIATNIAYDHQRHTRHMHWLPWEQQCVELERVYERNKVASELIIEEAELLTIALARVSLTYRACLILYIIEDLPQRQIAERLGIKEASVSKYVSRGLEELRRIYLHLARENGTPEEEGNA
ncbi:MAG: RNA polymerase sigma factor [Chloroflexota bacterium]|nr:RNA polymerase sigma factor [Chloroflexota bacterium]